MFLADSGGARREGAASLLQPVWHSHASGAADQAPDDATVQTEHLYTLAEEGRRDREPMRGGVLQTHRRIRGGVYRGGVYFQISGKYIGAVIQRLAGSLPKHREGTSSMELAGENAKEGGGGAMSVRNVLSVGGPGSIIFRADTWVLSEAMSQNPEEMQMGFLRQITGQKKKKQRYGTWRSLEAE